MKFNETIVVEQSEQYVVKKISTRDREALHTFADFYNSAGQLTWVLTPTRLLQKIGTKGRLWGLYTKSNNELVGTIGLKHLVDDSNHDLGEIGYTMVAEGHRSLPNVMKLFKAALVKAKTFDAVFITTNTKNRTMNKLLDRTPKTDKLFMVKSPYNGSSNKLFVYAVNTTSSPDRIEILRAYFENYLIQDM